MTWATPAAAWALLALALPILVHTLVRRRATPAPFPTLRFIPRTRLASIERRALDDLVLLFVRLGILTAAVAAVAGPFVMTASRRRAWNDVTIRAEVNSGSVAAGMHDALVWLDTQPPGRRELIVRSPFPIGSISEADVAAVPADVGLRFERTGTLPPTRSLPAPSVFARDGDGSFRHVQREVRLDGERTSVRDIGATEATGLPIEITAPAVQRKSIEALLTAAIGERVAAPIGGRTARLEVVERLAPGQPPEIAAIRSPWMANAVARIWRDAPLSAVRFSADGERLLVAVDSTIVDAALVDLARSVLAAIAQESARPGEEIVPIPDAQLRAWSRQPGPAGVPAPDRRPRDARWFWLLVLALLGIEALVRRAPERSRVA